MNIRGLTGVVRRNKRLIVWGAASTAALAWLLFYKLGSLTGRLAQGEVSAIASPVGWHGIYSQPFYLPLQILRSVDFSVFSGHGQALDRLPNALLGGLAVVSFAGLIRSWYGSRIAALATAMFAAGAWSLHVSRFASYDVTYLWALPALLLAHFTLQKHYRNLWVWFGSLATWGLLIYIPGMVWFVLVDVYLQRRFVAGGFRRASSWWQRLLYIGLAIAWLPLLTIDLTRPGNFMTWLGLPEHFGSASDIAKGFAHVPEHLFARGPQDPALWLGRTPILDVFALAICIMGIYFYISHWKSARSRYLAILALVGFVLVGVGGPVPLSVLVPLLYVAIATGLAYLLSQWLKVFPNNPLARGLGLGLVVLAVFLSCLYNYRAYFIAWPHTAATKATFQYHRRP